MTLISASSTLPTIAECDREINNGFKLSDAQAQVVAKELATLVEASECGCGSCLPVSALARFGNGEGVWSDALLDELTAAITQTTDDKELSRIAAFTIWLANKMER